ncbi:hypothetical protein GWK47_000062 [Chionoecetes opilio]|uniref:Uncharacterized protein n=1 Tax=Chionoecetes opilio TaxID=41210 RepID=A0A8J5CXS8_CHIOP|nr:hypothetical protein GWK47_000062 [Chionoecetes opilio]
MRRRRKEERRAAAATAQTKGKGKKKAMPAPKQKRVSIPRHNGAGSWWSGFSQTTYLWTPTVPKTTNRRRLRGEMKAKEFPCSTDVPDTLVNLPVTISLTPRLPGHIPT